MNDHTHYLTLGIDIGGTNTVFGIVDADGNIVCRGRISTLGHPDFSDFIAALHKEVTDVMSDAGIDMNALAAVGVGAPCLNCETGVIEGAVNLPWPSPLPLTALLEDAFGRPVTSENDANAAALGEMCFGAARGMRNFIMITLGTGVGSALVCDGRLLRGHRGLAGELGHIPVRRGESARKCNCGLLGCLDAYLSARGIVDTASELIETTDLPSCLRQLSVFDASDVGSAAVAGDSLAFEVMNRSGRLLGEACAGFTAMTSPEAFIFFGGVAESFPLFEDAMRQAYSDHLLWVYDGQTSFIRSALPAADAAVLGAAAAARVKIKL